MRMRRFLAAFLATAMVCSGVPASVFAAGPDPAAEEQGKLYLDKTATLEDDGSYTIDMEAFATGKTTTQTIEKGVPLDIVLVLDQSGSMEQDLGKGKKQDALKTAAKNFVDAVYQDGQKHHVEHRIGIASFAGGNESKDHKKYRYMHTGIYDKMGEFVGYEKAMTEQPPVYEKYTDRPLDPKGIYFVKTGNTGKPSDYVQLKYNSYDNYAVVSNPSTDRTDLYGQVNGNYRNAVFGEYTVSVDVKNPTKDDGKIYYDDMGNQLSWIEEMTSEYTKVNSLVDDNETQKKGFYIDYNQGKGTPDWHRVSYEKTFTGNYRWIDDGSSVYNIENNQFVYSHLFGRKSYYDAYELAQNPTGNWILSADGTKYTGKVHMHEVRTGWNAKGVPVETLYELSRADKWQYAKDENTHDLTDLTTETVYIKTQGSLFQPSLVPVADGDNGLGNKRPNFDKAIDSLAAEGPTRIEKGIELGNKFFYANPIPADSERQRVMIVFTDGEPGYSEYEEEEANAAIAQTNITKATYGAKVYTIGLYDNEKSKQKTFMENMSSNTKTDKKYYHKVSDAAALNDVFKSIQEDISGSTTTVDLTTTSILRDIMSPEGFELTDQSVITVSIVPGDATDKTRPEDTEWGTPVEVLKLTNPTNGKTEKVIYEDPLDGSVMTIKVSTHMNSPEHGNIDLHTVEVTGFDYKNQYIAKAHKGSKLAVKITGVKALPTVTTDRNIYTNHEQSGIWTPATSGEGRQLKAPFPKMPQTHMTLKSYVVDYAKPLNLALKDIKMDSAVNVDIDGYDPFSPAATEIKDDYGDVKIVDGKLQYSPKTMKWDDYDAFYVFGKTSDADVKSASANNVKGNLWSKVNVIPANNVYYEDSFVTNSTSGSATIISGINYESGSWTEVNGEAPNANTNSGAAEDASTPNDNHGWIPVLEGETGDTDGTSHKGTATQDENGNFTAAKATFEFTGTGVDVYSRTNNQSGTIMARLLDSNGNLICTKIIDTLSASGEYFQIPTLTFHDNGTKDENGKYVPLTYGTYKVELYVTGAAAGESRFEYYLDGIRVYNPIKSNDTIVDKAYGPDELNASFVEVRDMLLDSKSFAADPTVPEKGFVFIDQLKEGQIQAGDMPTQAMGSAYQSSNIGTYKDYGPKNEVYLNSDQMISFKVDTTKGNKYYIGLKSPEGKDIQVVIPGVNEEINTITLNHTADMYYEVTPDANGIISVYNKTNTVEGADAASLLSVTKLKVTNANGDVNVAEVLVEAPAEELLAASRTFAFEAEKQAASQKPVAPSNPDVDIENPETPVDPNAHTMEEIKAIISQIFDGFRNWI